MISLADRVLGPGGEIVGVGAISISLNDLSSIIEHTKIGERGYVLLFQDDGVFLVDPRHPEFIFKNARDIPVDAYAGLLGSSSGDPGPRSAYAPARLGKFRYESCRLAFEKLGFTEVALIDERDIADQLRPLLLSLSVIAVVVAGFMCAIFLIVTIREYEEVIKDRERYFRQIFEDVKLLVVGLDIEGKIQFANDFLLDWSGYRREEILYRNWLDLFSRRRAGTRSRIAWKT